MADRGEFVPLPPLEEEANELQALLTSLTPRLVQYWKEHGEEEHVGQAIQPAALSEQMDLQFPSVGAQWNGTLPYLELLLKFSPRTRHPLFLDKLYPGTNPIGMISELITAVLNTNVHVFKVAPAIICTELAVMKKLANIFEMPGGDGVTCPGGSFSNMLAMITARNIRFPQIKQSGYRGFAEELVVITSEEAHYSLKKACMVLGLGMDSLVLVGTDDTGAMCPGQLRETLRRVTSEGKVPFFVNATSGTTVRGAYDPLAAIGGICEEFGCWMHVDACWGGAAIFSEQHKPLMRGCGRADSIAWNAHKLLGVPIQTSLLVVKDPKALKESNSLDQVSYLFHGDDDSGDVGRKTIMCGRRADVLKFYMTWLYYGSHAFTQWVDHAFFLAQALASRVQEHPEFSLIYPTISINVCFRYVPAKLCGQPEEKINAFNQQIHSTVMEEGKIYIDSDTHPVKGVFFRVVFHNPHTRLAHVQAILDAIERIGQSMMSAE